MPAENGLGESTLEAVVSPTDPNGAAAAGRGASGWTGRDSPWSEQTQKATKSEADMIYAPRFRCCENYKFFGAVTSTQNGLVDLLCVSFKIEDLPYDTLLINSVFVVRKYSLIYLLWSVLPAASIPTSLVLQRKSS